MSVGRKFDALIGLGLIVLAAYVYSAASAMPALKRGLGPGGYPKFAAVGLIILGAVLVIQTLFSKKGEGKPLFTITWHAIGRVVVFLAMIYAYILAVEPAGFVLASAVFLFIGSLFCGYRRYGIAAVVGVAIPLSIYLVFRYVFLVLIPTGTIFG